MNPNRFQLLRRPALVVFVVALVIRLLFVGAVLEAQDPTELRRLNGDSREYLRLAEHFAQTGRYSPRGEENVDLAVVSLVRTPAYPTLLAGLLKAEELVGLSPEPLTQAERESMHWARTGPGGRAFLTTLFLLQAIVDATLAALAALIAKRLWRRNAAAWVAGMLMAFCPTGWGLSAIVLTDGWFAFFVGLGLWLTLRGATSRRWWPAVMAGVAWSLGMLMKPTLLLFPVALPVVWLLARLGRSRGGGARVPMGASLLRLGVCWGLLVATIVGWASYNRAVHGVFAVSIVGERNLRFMYGPYIEVWAKLGEKPPGDLVTERYYRMGHQDLEWLREPGMTPAEFVRRQREYIDLLLPEHPEKVLRLYLKNLEGNVVGSWDVFVNQLPPRDGEPVEIGGMGTGGRLTPAARAVFGPFVYAEGLKPLRWLLFSLAICSPLIAFVRKNGRKGWLALGVWVVAAYLLLTAATTGGQGSRILYPAYAPAVALLSGWVTVGLRRGRK